MYYFNRQTGDYGDAANLILVPNDEVDMELVPDASESEIIDAAILYERTEAGTALADKYIALVNSQSSYHNLSEEAQREADDMRYEEQKETLPPLVRGYRDLL
jgi:hypothetical protein